MPSVEIRREAYFHLPQLFMHAAAHANAQFEQNYGAGHVAGTMTFAGKFAFICAVL